MLQNETIKQIGANGQVCLGKEYANKHVLISKMEDGTLIIKTGKFITEGLVGKGDWSHSKTYSKEFMEALDRALDWAESTPSRDNFDEIAAKIKSND